MADLATYNKQALAQSEPQATINPKNLKNQCIGNRMTQQDNI